MGIVKAIVNGMGTSVRKPRVLVILYAFNVAFAAAFALPVLAIVQSELGHSFLGTNVRPADLSWLGEAALKYGNAAPALIAGLAAVLFLYLALQVFLSGGVVGRLLDKEGRPTLGAFFGDCGRYLGRFTRLFLVSLVFLFLTFGVVLRLLAAVIEPLREGAATEWLPLILANVHLFAALLLLSIVRMIVDYVRIAVVADDERRVLKALRHALTFLKKRFFRAWALYLLIVAGTLAGTIVFYALLGPLGRPSVGAVVAAFVLMQLYIAFRLGIRMLFVAAQAEFYRSHPY
jgi:hypothetical protein